MFRGKLKKGVNNTSRTKSAERIKSRVKIHFVWSVTWLVCLHGLVHCPIGKSPSNPGHLRRDYTSQTRELAMNWTGGQLRRHSAKKGVLTKAQRHKFANSRQLSGRASYQPSPFRGLPDLTTEDKEIGADSQTQSVAYIMLFSHGWW